MVASLGLSFHRTFALNRPALAQLLSVAGARPLTFDTIRENTALGTVYAEAMPRYAQGCGLIGDSGLTPLGQLVAGEDPYLGSEATMWIMHYHMSKPQGPGPEYWQHVVRTEIVPGRLLRSSLLARSISDHASCSGLRPSERTARSAATAFLGTYSKPEALGPLGIMSKVLGGRYQVNAPRGPSRSVFGYSLADFWEEHWPSSLTVDLEDVAGVGGPGSIFVMSRQRCLQLLVGLQSLGVVGLDLGAPPFQVVRLWRSKLRLMGSLYVCDIT